MRVMGVSERFACRVTGQNRTNSDARRRRWRRPSRMPRCVPGYERGRRTTRGAGFATPITTRAARAGRCTTRRASGSGGGGLRVPQRRRRNGLGTSTTPNLPSADAPNRVWAVDFQSTPPPTGARSRSPPSSTSTPANASADSSNATSPTTTSSPNSTASPRFGLPGRAALRQRARARLPGDGRLGPRTHRAARHPARRAMAHRPRRAVQLPHPRRMPGHQHLLEPGPRPAS